MSNKQKQRLMMLSCVLAALIFVVSAGATVAAWRTQGTTVQHTEIASLAGELIETGTEDAVIYPQEYVDYAVYARNTGTVDGLVRVSVDTRWGRSRTEEGDLIADPDFDLAYIELDYNTDAWIFDPDSGYYYYKGVLSPDEDTPALFDSIALSEKTDNDYSGVQFDVIFNMEMVQAGYNGISYWGKTMEEFGIAYQDPITPPAMGTAVFYDPEAGFSFAGANGLFMNMENLQPGETRSQQVSITNDWNEDTIICLQLRSQAENVDPHTVKLFSQYTKLTIADDTGKVLYEGALWEADGTPATIALGVFDSGEKKELNVWLSIDTGVDNAYSDLYGDTLWVFMAEGVETPVAPETGEATTWLYVAVSVLLISGLALAILLLLLAAEKSKSGGTCTTR